MPLFEQIYNTLLEDPDLEIGEGQSREDAARIEAEQRARQYINNVQALSLANEPLNKEYFPHLLFAGLILKALDASDRDLLIRNFSEAFGEIVRGKPEYASPQKAKKALRNLISEAVAGGATQADISYARKHAVEQFSDVSQLGEGGEVTTKKMKEILSEYGIDVRAKGDLFRISGGKGISKPKKDLVYDPRGKNRKAYGKGKLRDYARAKARNNAGKKQTKAQKAKKEPVEISEDDVNEIMEHEQRLEEFMSEVHGKDWRDKADKDRKQNKLHGLHKVVDRYQKYPKELENDHKIKIIDPAKNAPDIAAEAEAKRLEAQKKQDAIDLKEREKAEGVAKKERIKQAKQLPHGKGHLKPHLNEQGNASPVRANKHARELIAHLQQYNDEMQEDPALMKKFHEAIQEAIDHGADIPKIREEINEYGENFGTPEYLQQALNKDIKLAKKHEKQRKAIGMGQHVGSSAIQDAMDNPDGHHHFDDISPEHEALIDKFKESRNKLQQGKERHENTQKYLEAFEEWEASEMGDWSDAVEGAEFDYGEFMWNDESIKNAFEEKYPDVDRFGEEKVGDDGRIINEPSPEWEEFKESDVFKELMKPLQEDIDDAKQKYSEAAEGFKEKRPSYEKAIEEAQQEVEALQSAHDEIEKEFNDSDISEKRKHEVHGTEKQKALNNYERAKKNHDALKEHLDDLNQPDRVWNPAIHDELSSDLQNAEERLKLAEKQLANHFTPSELNNHFFDGDKLDAINKFKQGRKDLYNAKHDYHDENEREYQPDWVLDLGPLNDAKKKVQELSSQHNENLEALKNILEPHELKQFMNYNKVGYHDKAILSGKKLKVARQEKFHNLDGHLETTYATSKRGKQVKQHKAKPAELTNELQLADGTTLKMSDAVNVAGRQIIAVEMPDGSRQGFYRRTGEGTTDADEKAIEDANPDLASDSSWVPMDGVTQSGWFDKAAYTSGKTEDGEDLKHGHSLFRWGNEQNKAIGKALQTLTESGMGLGDEDESEHEQVSNIEANAFIGSEKSLAQIDYNNKQALEVGFGGFDDDHNYNQAKREENFGGERFDKTGATLQGVAPEDRVAPDTGMTEEEIARQQLEAKMAAEGRVINPATGRWIKKENLDELQQGMGDFDGKLVNGMHQIGDHNFAVDDDGNAVNQNFFMDIHGNLVPVSDATDLSDEDSMSNQELVGRHFGELLGGEGGSLESHNNNPAKVSDIKNFWQNNPSPLAAKIAEKAKKNAEKRREEETQGMSALDRIKRGWQEGTKSAYENFRTKKREEYKSGFEASYRRAKAKNKNLKVADHAKEYFSNKPEMLSYIDAKMKDKTLTPKKHKEQLAGLNEPGWEDYSYNPMGNQRDYNRPIEKGDMTNINLFLDFIKDQQTHDTLTVERDINRLIEHVKHNKKLKKEV